MKPENGCPSTWALERLLLGEEGVSVELRRHVENCELCQAELARRRAVGDEFMGSPTALALEQRLSGRRPPRRASRTRWLPAVALLAAVAGVWLMPKDPERARSDLTAKGASTLALWVERDGSKLLLTDPLPRVKPGERLQAEVSSPRTIWVVLVLVDPSGDATALVWENVGAERLEAGVRRALGPSFRVDDEQGRYRLMSFRADDRFEIEAAERSAVSGEHFEGEVQVLDFVVGP